MGSFYHFVMQKTTLSRLCVCVPIKQILTPSALAVICTLTVLLMDGQPNDMGMHVLQGEDKKAVASLACTDVPTIQLSLDLVPDGRVTGVVHHYTRVQGMRSIYGLKEQ